MNLKTKKKNILRAFLSLFLALAFSGSLAFLALEKPKVISAEEMNYSIGKSNKNLLVSGGDVLLIKNEENIFFENGIELRAKKDSEIQVDSVSKEKVEITLKKGDIWANAYCSSAKVKINSENISLDTVAGSFGISKNSSLVQVKTGNGITWARIMPDKEKKEYARSFALLEESSADIYEPNLSLLYKNLLYSKIKKELKIKSLNESEEDIAEYILNNRKKDFQYCVQKKSELENKISENEKALEKGGILMLENFRDELTFNEKNKAINSLKNAKKDVLNIFSASDKKTQIQKIENFTDTKLKFFNDRLLKDYSSILFLAQRYSIFLDEEKFPYEEKEKFISILSDEEIASRYIKFKEITDLFEKTADRDKNTFLNSLKEKSEKDLELIKNLFSEGENEEALYFIEMWRNIIGSEATMNLLEGEDTMEIERKFENLALEITEDENKNYALRLEFALRKLDILNKILEEIFANQSLDKLPYAKKMLDSYKALELEEKTQDTSKRIQFIERITPIDLKIQFLTSIAGNEREINDENFKKFNENISSIDEIIPLFEKQNIKISKNNLELADSTLKNFSVNNAVINISDRNIGFSCIYNIDTNTCKNFSVYDYRSVKKIDKKIKIEKIQEEIKTILDDK